MNKNNGKIWNNTHLCVSLKTQLRTDRCATSGKSYQGVLRYDAECEEFRYDEHFTFIETMPQGAAKRNPHVFDGKYVSVTLRDNGSYRPNLKQTPRLLTSLDVECYAFEVYRELRNGLISLVEKG